MPARQTEDQSMAAFAGVAASRRAAAVAGAGAYNDPAVADKVAAAPGAQAPLASLPPVSEAAGSAVESASSLPVPASSESGHDPVWILLARPPFLPRTLLLYGHHHPAS